MVSLLLFHFVFIFVFGFVFSFLFLLLFLTPSSSSCLSSSNPLDAGCDSYFHNLLPANSEECTSKERREGKVRREEGGTKGIEVVIGEAGEREGGTGV